MDSRLLNAALALALVIATIAQGALGIQAPEVTEGVRVARMVGAHFEDRAREDLSAWASGPCAGVLDHSGEPLHPDEKGDSCISAGSSWPS